MQLEPRLVTFPIMLMNAVPAATLAMSGESTYCTAAPLTFVAPPLVPPKTPSAHGATTVIVLEARELSPAPELRVTVLPVALATKLGRFPSWANVTLVTVDGPPWK